MTGDRVFLVPTIRDPEHPTTVELNAGTEITSYLTGDWAVTLDDGLVVTDTTSVLAAFGPPTEPLPKWTDAPLIVRRVGGDLTDEGRAFLDDIRARPSPGYLVITWRPESAADRWRRYLRTRRLRAAYAGPIRTRRRHRRTHHRGGNTR